MASAQLLHGIANDVVNELVRAVGNHVQSGDLINGISYEIRGNQIVILAPEHWQYLEYGTPGQRQGQSSTVGGQTVSFGPNTERKMPLRREGNEWINLITNQPGDFALAKHIQLYGTRPYPFVRPTMYHKLLKIIEQNVKRHGVSQ